MAATITGTQVDILSADKPPGAYASTKNENLSVAAGATATLLDAAGPGYLSSLFIAVTCGQKAAFQDSLLKIYYDGEATPTVSVPVSDFFASHYMGDASPPSWYSQYLGANANYADTSVSYYCFFPVPFSSHCKITLTNAAGANAMTLWTVATCHAGVANAWPRTRKLRVANARLTGVAPNTVVTLLDASTLGLRGRLLGTAWNVDSGGGAVSFNYLEGNVKYYLDGSATASYESSGMEDHSLMGFYFQGTDQVAGVANTSMTRAVAPYIGVPFRNAQTPGATQYRLHIPDPVVFNTGLKVTAQVGDTSQNNYAGNVSMSYVVWYYTEG